MDQKRSQISLIISLSNLLILGGCQSFDVGQDLLEMGLTYELRMLEEPIPNRVHVLRVDLAQGMLRPAVVIGEDPDGAGPAETVLEDPLRLAEHPLTVAFVNSNPWMSFPDADGNPNTEWYRGQPVDIHGLAVSGGRLRSEALEGGICLWTNSSGKVHLSPDPGDGVVEGVAGFSQILQSRKIIAPPEGPRHPRTAAGVNEDGNVLWLVVVDGRQKGFSEGMTTYELAKIMRELGSWHAANMDGGGSSIMCLADSAGNPDIVNRPSDSWRTPTRNRPLPLVLTIRKLE